MDLSALLALVPAKDAVYVTAVCGVAAVAATLLPHPVATPTTSWQRLYVVLYDVVNVIGANVGKATNAKPST